MTAKWVGEEDGGQKYLVDYVARYRATGLRGLIDRGVISGTDRLTSSTNLSGKQMQDAIAKGLQEEHPTDRIDPPVIKHVQVDHGERGGV